MHKTVISLFDGHSGGRLALDRAGVHFDRYIASEIDKHAIASSERNYKDIVRAGDVRSISYKEGILYTEGGALSLKDPWLLIGGSPCQSFSSAGSRTGFEGKSGLFYEYFRVLNELKPKWFLLENVKMKKEWESEITKYLGVEPIEINSSRVSAQNRVRLYWTNIPNVGLPEDKGITLHDILEDGIGGFSKSDLRKATIVGRPLDQSGVRIDWNKNLPIIQCLEVRKSNIEKSNCLTTFRKDNVLTTMPEGRHPNAFKEKYPFRYYTLKEMCRLQTVPEDYFDGVSESQAMKMLGNGWTIDVISHILSKIPE